jgi:hypothetical protein
MSTPIVQTEEPSVDPSPSKSNLDRLAERTSAFAAALYDEVAAAYLQFRRAYYHDAQPSLATTPHASAEVSKAEVALLAENTLKVLPKAVTGLPILGGVIEHLQQVADLNSVSEAERATLHNMTMALLYGIKHGMQPWYVEWALASARRLAHVLDTGDSSYFMAYPWDTCLYFAPQDLARFEEATRTGEIEGIEQAMRQIAARLITALSNPLDAQFEFAFTGPDAERRRTMFRLQTAATIALGAYLITEEVRTLLQPRGRQTTPPSALAPLPPELAAHMTASASQQ